MFIKKKIEVVSSSPLLFFFPFSWRWLELRRLGGRGKMALLGAEVMMVRPEAKKADGIVRKLVT